MCNRNKFQCGTIFKIIPWRNHEPFLFTIFQFLKFQFGVLHLTRNSESHAIDSSDSAQRLCIKKGQIHVVNKSFIWQPGQLSCVDIIPLFLSIHPPNSCFFFSFSSFDTSSHIFYLPLLLFSCLSLLSCCWSFWGTNVHWTGEHPVSLVFFGLSFSFGLYSLNPILTYRTVTKNRHGFLLCAISWKYVLLQTQSEKSPMVMVLLTLAVSGVWVLLRILKWACILWIFWYLNILWIFETLKPDITHLTVTKIYFTKCTLHFHSGMTLLY